MTNHGQHHTELKITSISIRVVRDYKMKGSMQGFVSLYADKRIDLGRVKLTGNKSENIRLLSKKNKPIPIPPGSSESFMFTYELEALQQQTEKEFNKKIRKDEFLGPEYVDGFITSYELLMTYLGSDKEMYYGVPFKLKD